MAVDWSVLNTSLKSKFGESVTITPSGGSPETVTAVPQGGDDFEQRVQGAAASIWIDLTDYDSPADGDIVVCSGVTGIEDGTYSVVEVRKDGSGGAWLDLQWVRS